MRLGELAGTGRQPPAPLALELPGGTLQVTAWLRVLPGQRYVGAGHWQGRPVLAKLLVGTKAPRHFPRERDGARLLAAQGLDTPALLAEGLDAEGGWLLFEWLEAAQSLYHAWQAAAGDAPRERAVLAEALAAIARLHLAGLWQSDLHLDNLLRHAGRLYLIDGGGVRGEAPGAPLSNERIAENLGLFLAQLPPRLETGLPELLDDYRTVAASHTPEAAAVLAALRKQRAWRQRDYLDKAGRDCTLFAVRRGLGGLEAVWRAAAADVAPILADPDAAIAAGHCCKNGGSATVARVEAGGRRLLIKRYNIKGPLHALKRFWRPSRAWHSWIEGHRLGLWGIATPQPLAVIERRWGGLRGRAYLITDYLDGQDIIACFEPYLATSPPEPMLLALDALFADLIRARISHGDFKGTNLFWTPQARQWALIDLDAVRQHASADSFERAYQRDRARFLRNWPADSTLHRLLDARLPKSGLKQDA